MRCFHSTPFSRGQRLKAHPNGGAIGVFYSREFRAHTSIRRISTSISQEARVDGRVRLSQLWVPSGGGKKVPEKIFRDLHSILPDSHGRLIQAGFLHQAHSGLFHMLPLGRRVQDKLEALIDKHMFQIGASKLALSSVSSEQLWSISGRLNSAGELFRFKDRKGTGYLLSPTHEEEITSLVSSTVKSYKDFPIRLYQITRKYRDELRPRHGLLRSREFVMKDLYTFDCTSLLALETYHQVRAAYARLFDELKLPYLVAEADSGDMGGNLSHEFHFPTAKGEDHVISCNKCDYVANEELAESAIRYEEAPKDDVQQTLTENVQIWRGISRDRATLFNVWYSTSGSAHDSLSTEVNVHAVKAAFPGIDVSIDNAIHFWASQDAGSRESPRLLINLMDNRLMESTRSGIKVGNYPLPLWPSSINKPMEELAIKNVDREPTTGKPLNLLRIREGDLCPRCPDGTLNVQKAIELGHTFHLGTRYSKPLDAYVELPEGSAAAGHRHEHGLVPLQMGCHGIGVSRMIGAVADTLADEKGLNWPRVMAPFEVMVVPATGMLEEASKVYDILNAEINGHLPDLILDDRQSSFPWKMRDADLVGYPVLVVVGKRWKDGMCEVQCRQLKVHSDVGIDLLPQFVADLLSQL